MRKSPVPQVLTIALAPEDQMRLERVVQTRYVLVQARDFAEAEAFLDETAALLVAVDSIPDAATRMREIARQFPSVRLMSATDSPRPEHPNPVALPLDPELVMDRLEQLIEPVAADHEAADLISDYSPPSKVARGAIVSSRVTSDWGQGVVLSMHEIDVCMVIFPQAPGRLKGKPIRCHVSTLKVQDRIGPELAGYLHATKKVAA